MKHKSFFTLLAAALMTMSAWAIGPQSLKVTFDGTDNAGWEADVASSNQQVANGIISVTQELQSNNQYRGDIKFNKNNDGAKTFAMNPNKDKYIAIKFVGSRPEGKLKFEFKNVDNRTWCNMWQYTPASMDAADGKVYYFTLTDDAKYTADHLDADGNFIVRQMNFILADNPNAEANTYQVDWIATFESLEDIKAWVNWNDEIAHDSQYPVAEFGYRIKTDNSWDSSTPQNGWSNAALEARYGSRLFTIMLFQIENFQSNAVYTLSLHKGGGGAGELGVWNFPHADIPVVSSQSAATLAAYAKAVTGVGMDMTGEKINPIATSTCNSNVWSFTLPGTCLTAISTDANGVSLVGLLITTPDLTNSSAANAHIATCGNATAANYPTLEKTGSYAVINTTKMVGYTTLEEAVTAAEHNDVLEIYENVELGDRINTNDRALTIQGHTGTEVITRKAGYTGLMFLTTNNENAALTVRNLIVDGNNIATTSQVFEASNGKTTNLENVTIQNVNVTNDYGSVICNKSTGALTLNNVTIQNCTCIGGTNNTPSVIFVGTYHVTLKGNNQFINCGEVPAIRIENNYYMSADGELTNTTPITIQLGTHIDGNSVVKSCTDKSKFALVNTPFVLANVDGNLVAKDYILMNITQDLGYNTFADAIADAEDGDIIEIRKDITTPSGRTDIDKAITFKAVNGAVIYNGTSDNNMLFLSQSADGVTLEDIIIDGADKNRDDIATMEAGSNKRLILKNVTIRNLTSGRDVTNNGYIELYGNNVLPNGIRLNMNRYVTDHETTHTTPIHFSLATDYIENADAVHGTTDYTRYSVSKDGVKWETYADTEHNQVRVRTIRVPLTYDLTVSAAGMATLVLGFDVPVLPAGVKAYTLTNDGSNVITATEVNSLTANEPVLIIAAERAYTFESEAGAVLDEAANPTNGCLIGTYTDIISIDLTTGDHHNYILASGDAGVGFYQVLKAGYSINSHHAYLSCGYNASAGASHAPMRIRFSTETATDIHSAATDSSIEKLLINGVLYIRKADHIYSIDGMMIR